MAGRLRRSRRLCGFVSGSGKPGKLAIRASTHTGRSLLKSCKETIAAQSVARSVAVSLWTKARSGRGPHVSYVNALTNTSVDSERAVARQRLERAALGRGGCPDGGDDHRSLLHQENGESKEVRLYKDNVRWFPVQHLPSRIPGRILPFCGSGNENKISQLGGRIDALLELFSAPAAGAKASAS